MGTACTIRDRRKSGDLFGTLWGFKITFAILIFFQKIFNYSYERARRVGHKNWSPRSQNLTLDFLNILEGPKMDRKSLNYFSAF